MKTGKRCLALLISALMVLTVMPVISVSATAPADYFEDFSTLTGSATSEATAADTTQKFKSTDISLTGSNYVSGAKWSLTAYGIKGANNTISFDNGVLKLTNTRSSTVGAGWSSLGRLTGLNDYIGVVEIAFDLTTKITNGGSSYANSFVSALNGTGAIANLASFNERNVYFGSNNTETKVILATHNAGAEHTVRYIFEIDYNNDKITAYTATYNTDGSLKARTYKGEKSFTGETPVNGLYFKSGNWGPAWAEGDYIAFDNLSVKQTAPLSLPMVLEDDGIDDSLKGINIKDSFNLDFSDTINAATLAGVKLCEGGADGTEVEATIGAKGDKLNITPKADLKPETMYTIVVPNTVAGAAGNPFAGYTVSFYTSDGSEFAASYDFETLATTATEWDVIKYLESKGLDVRLQIGTGANAAYVTDASSYTTNASRFDENSGLIITEDGRLKIASEDNIDSLYLTLTPDADKIEDADIVEIELDLQMATTDKQINDFINIYSGGGKLFRMDNFKGVYWYLMNAATNAFDTNVMTDLAFGTHKMKLVADMNAGTVDVYADGVLKKTSAVVDAAKGTPFVNFKIQLNSVTDDKFTHVFVDNLKLREVVNPAVSNAADYKDATGVSAADDIVLKFNTPMSDAGIDGITLDGDPVSATLSESGYTLTIDADLAKGTEYTLAIPALTALNGRAFTAASYTFKTEEDVPVFALSLKNADDEELAAGAALPTGAFTVKATCAKTGGAADIYMLVGLFDEGGCLLEVAGGSDSMPAGEASVTKTASFANADNKGKTVKVFLWKSLTTCETFGIAPLVRP